MKNTECLIKVLLSGYDFKEHRKSVFNLFNDDSMDEGVPNRYPCMVKSVYSFKDNKNVIVHKFRYMTDKQLLSIKENLENAWNTGSKI